MNTDILKGKWKQLKGEARKKWGDLTDDDFDKIQGDGEKLIGILQEKYGYARDRAEREVKEFLHGSPDGMATAGTSFQTGNPDLTGPAFDEGEIGNRQRDASSEETVSPDTKKRRVS